MLPRLLGSGRALDLLLTGRRFTAADALRYGLVTQIVARADLEATSVALLSDILRAPGIALSAAKRAVVEGLDLALADAMTLERRLATSLSV